MVNETIRYRSDEIHELHESRVLFLPVVDPVTVVLDRLTGFHDGTDQVVEIPFRDALDVEENSCPCLGERRAPVYMHDPCPDRACLQRMVVWVAVLLRPLARLTIPECVRKLRDGEHALLPVRPHLLLAHPSEEGEII